MQISTQNYSQAFLDLLIKLIATPSFSKEEDQTASLIANFFYTHEIPFQRKGNNIWARNLHFQPQLPTILLNSHHDTVKPAHGWHTDPFDPVISEDVLTGLGSNDAGGPLVSLIGAFIHYYASPELPYNLILAATAEEEISGNGGIALILPELGEIDLGIIGEPTQMQMAIAEKGLMVLDGYAKGKSGHAAREEGVNAIYEALPDLHWFQSFQFPQQSPFLGPVKMTVSQIQAGTQHNVVPDNCHFVVDVRTTEMYTNEQTLAIIQAHVKSEIIPRSLRLAPSGISLEHPIVKKGMELGLSYFGSPTLSDQALIPYPTIKVGPGNSARSHTPNEFIRLSEIREGISLYIQLLNRLVLNK